MLRHAAVVASLGFVTLAHAQQVLYEQPSSGTPAWSSQDARNLNGLGWFSEAADDFTAQAGWSVTRLQWFGSYATPDTDRGNTEGFTVRFYEDNGGLPGTRIYEQDILMSDVTETFLSIWTSNFAYYGYEADLPVSFDVPDAGEYWVSIVAILARGGTAQEPQWFIGTAPFVTGASAATWFFSPGNFANQGGDVAFTLLGNEGTSCLADLSSPGNPGIPDGLLSGADFFEFLARFGAGDLSVDFSSPANPGQGDGLLSGADFFEFLNLFAQGC